MPKSSIPKTKCWFTSASSTLKKGDTCTLNLQLIGGTPGAQSKWSVISHDLEFITRTDESVWIYGGKNPGSDIQTLWAQFWLVEQDEAPSRTVQVEVKLLKEPDEVEVYLDIDSAVWETKAFYKPQLECSVLPGESPPH